MRTLSLLLSLTLLSTATTAQDTAPDAADSTYSQVPLMLEGGYALVPVSIDGLDSLLFVLDTAASASVVSPATRDALGFSEDEGGIAQVLGASGPTEYQLLELDALTVGGRTERGLRVAVIDLDRFEQGETTYAGILGNDVLRRFDVEYDRPGAVLGLYAQGTVPPERLAGTEAVPFAGGGFGGFIRFDATLGGAPVTAIVDTGAGRSVFNTAAAALEGATTDSEGVQRQDEGTRGLGDAVTETYLYTFENFAVEAVRFEPREVRIADLPVFGALGLAEEPAIILGNDVIGQRPVFLLYSSGTAHFGSAVR